MSVARVGPVASSHVLQIKTTEDVYRERGPLYVHFGVSVGNQQREILWCRHEFFQSR